MIHCNVIYSFHSPSLTCYSVLYFQLSLLHGTVIICIIPSILLFHCISTSAALFYLPSLSTFHLLSLIPSRPPANFPTVPFPTSSFLSVSLLIYLSCWACTRSDALPLCLCCMCVICIPYLPMWNALLCIRPHRPHPNHSLCWLSRGSGHWRLHFTEQVALLQAYSQQMWLMQPIIIVPPCFLVKSPLWSVLFFYLKVPLPAMCRQVISCSDKLL